VDEAASADADDDLTSHDTSALARDNIPHVLTHRKPELLPPLTKPTKKTSKADPRVPSFGSVAKSAVVQSLVDHCVNPSKLPSKKRRQTSIAFIYVYCYLFVCIAVLVCGPFLFNVRFAFVSHVV
jgi:hypothetical protein